MSYPETQGVRGYKDLTPRFGVAYDLFGNAKTAVKFNMGKYLEASSNGVGFYSTTNPINRLTTSSGIRTWNDLNGNFLPDCDLLNMSPNLECGQGSTSFGKEVFTTNVDSAALGGWGVRPSDWGITASVQHEVLPRVSVEVGYTRRWLQHFVVTDNLDRDRGRFRARSALPRRRTGVCPDGGGYPVSGLYDVNLAFGGQFNNAAHVQRSASARIPGSTSATTASRSTSAPGRATGCCFRVASIPERPSPTTVPCGRCCRKSAPLNPVLPQRARVHHAMDRLDVLHDPEGGRQRQRDHQERSGSSVAGELVGAALGDRAVAWAPAVREPTVCDGQSRRPRRGLGGPRQRGRHPHRKDSPDSAGRERTSASISTTCSTLRRS